MNKKTIINFFSVILIAIMCLSFFTACNESETEKKYKQAFDLIETGDYVSAYNIFVELGDYKNSENEILKFHYGIETKSIKNIFNGEEDIVTYKTTYNSDNLPLKTEEISQNEVFHTCNYTYNENHKPIKVHCVLSDGSEEIHQYTYDNKNNMTKWTITTQYGTDVFDYEYYEDGKMKNINFLYADGTQEYSVYTYDDKGNNIRTNILDSAGEHIYEFTHDGNNNVIKEVYKLGIELISTTDYIYDENNNVIKETETGKSNTTVTNYIYDESNNLIKEEITNTSGLYYEHTYQYNELGQNIKEVQTFSQGFVTEIERNYKFVYVPYEISEEAWYELIYIDLGLDNFM